MGDLLGFAAELALPSKPVKVETSPEVPLHVEEGQPEQVYNQRTVSVPATSALAVRFPVSPDYFFVVNPDVSSVELNYGDVRQVTARVTIPSGRAFRLPGRGYFAVTLYNPGGTAIEVVVIGHDRDLRVDWR